MKNFLLIITLLGSIGLLIVLIIYKPEFKKVVSDDGPQRTYEQKIVDINLEIDAPFSSVTLNINNYGKMTYEADAPRMDMEKVSDVKDISPIQLQELFDLINKSNFWSFNEQYRDENITDATTYTLTIKSFPASQDPALSFPGSYSVTCYWECPEEIMGIIEGIKELWGEEILEIGV